MARRVNDVVIPEEAIAELDALKAVNEGRVWNEEELALMDKYYPWVPRAKLKKYLNRKTENQIYNQARRMGLSKRYK